MAKSKPTFLADVSERVALSRHRRLTWFDRLPPEAQAECVAVRDAFRRGELGDKLPVARAIIAAARERGWVVAGETQVGAWLSREN
jgi:hypothetical protein